MLHVMQGGMPDTQIIILGIYPRGSDFGDHRFEWPSHFTYSIDLLNALYQVSNCLLASARSGQGISAGLLPLESLFLLALQVLGVSL